MPAPQFKIHVDPDALARHDLAAAVSSSPAMSAAPGAGSGSGSGTAEKHGSRDERLAARLRSERDRAGRASGTGSGRSYAFRRS